MEKKKIHFSLTASSKSRKMKELLSTPPLPDQRVSTCPFLHKTSECGRNSGVLHTTRQQHSISIYPGLLSVYHRGLSSHIGLTIYHGLAVAGGGPGRARDHGGHTLPVLTTSHFLLSLGLPVVLLSTRKWR
jgi:hypothetical protein